MLFFQQHFDLKVKALENLLSPIENWGHYGGLLCGDTMGYYGKILPWKIETEVLTHTISIPRDLELFAGDFSKLLQIFQ